MGADPYYWRDKCSKLEDTIAALEQRVREAFTEQERLRDLAREAEDGATRLMKEVLQLRKAREAAQREAAALRDGLIEAQQYLRTTLSPTPHVVDSIISKALSSPPSPVSRQEQEK